MFEITREHDDALDYYMNERIAYPNAEYDFTFEGRFLIYHTVQGNKATYYAIDMKTNLSSEVCHRTEGLYDREAFKEMIPAILSSIKYTGDRRYIRGLAPDPMELIDSIFRSVLPEYGFFSFPSMMVVYSIGSLHLTSLGIKGRCPRTRETA